MEPNLMELLQNMKGAHASKNVLSEKEHSRASNLARSALVKLHRADYDSLLAQAKALVISERKPENKQWKVVE